MADVSQMTTEELLALRSKKQSARDLTSLVTGMTTEELLQARNRKLAQQRIEREQSEYPTFMGIDNAARSFSRGVPVVGGGLDEGSAFLNTGGGMWGDYGQELEYQRERDRQYDEAHPWLSTGGQLLGGVAGTIAGARYMPLPTMPTSMLGKIGASAGIGAGLGAIEGYTRGEGGMAERAANALPSAVGGSMVGAVAPPIAKGIGMGWTAIASWFANRGVDAKVANKIIGELQASGMSPQQAAQRLQQLGPEAMLADTASGMQNLAGGTMVSDGGAATLMGNRLGARMRNAPARVARDLDTAFGPARDPYAVRQDIRGQQAGIAPEYRQAIDNAPPLPANMGNQLAQSLTEPSRSMALANRGVMGNIMTQIDDALAAGDPRQTAARLLDIRKWLDAQIVYDPRALTQLSNADRASQGVLQQARATIDGVIKRYVPGIADADAQYSTTARNLRAFDEGRRDVLRAGPDTMTPEQLRATIAQSNASENAMRQQGVRTELDRNLQNQRRNPGLGAERIMNRDWNREKLAAMIGPQRSQNLNRALDRESTFLETSNLADPRRNSRTANLTETARRVWGRDAGPSTMGDALAAGAAGAMVGGPQMGMVAAGGSIAGNLRRKLGDMLSRGEKPEVIQRAADMLTATGGPSQDFIRMLERMAAQGPRQARTAKAIEDTARRLMIGQSGQVGYRGSDAFLPRVGR